MWRDIGIPDAEDPQRINTIIFDELVYGRIEAPRRSYVQDIIGRLKDRGCDAVAVGCTELPLVVSEAESPLMARAA
jgi:aspartate racemase